MLGSIHRHTAWPVRKTSHCARRTPIARHPRRRQAVTSAAASVEAPQKDSKPRPGEKKGFVEEMRFVAMKLHTKDQSREGGKEASQHPMREWKPSKQGYLNFLAESKVVYDTLETIVAEASDPSVAKFRDTGLERAGQLEKDIAWFKEQHGVKPDPINQDGPGIAYSQLLRKLANEDVPAFLCHFYNIYFAHTAGGRMIGTKVASMILDNAKLEFYKYNGDHKPLLENVRDRLNEVAGGWSRDQKDHCLQETEKSFQYSGGLLQLVAT